MKYKKIDYIKAMVFFGWKPIKATQTVNIGFWSDWPARNDLVRQYHNRKK